MSAQHVDSPLHLHDLRVARLRGIRELSIRRLGRVTLLAGRNGVGKTAVLEAVRVYASRGHYGILGDLLEEQDELLGMDRDERGFQEVDFGALFHGWNPGGGRISVGPIASAERLLVEQVDLIAELGPLIERSLPEATENGSVLGLRTRFGDAKQFLPVVGVPQEHDGRTAFTRARGRAWHVLRRSSDDSSDSSRIRCQTLGPGRITNVDIARYWERVVLTRHEDAAVEALRLAMDERVRRVAVLGSDGRSRRQSRIVVQIKGVADPVPLRSLGDGAVRLPGVALALANSENGFLLIDQVENGIHHSLQKDFWRMVLSTAQANNVQVLATTHSFDCVQGFAEASNEVSHIGGALVRVDRRGGTTWAVEYSERDLRIAAEQTIEVR